MKSLLVIYKIINNGHELLLCIKKEYTIRPPPNYYYFLILILTYKRSQTKIVYILYFYMISYQFHCIFSGF